MWWFWWWLVFLVLLFALPVTYGWGYRRWGPPYPSWWAARRARRRPVGAAAPAPEPVGWGALADLMWLVLLVALVWFVVAVVVA